jgi:ABC-type oligopeptide transport system substrate-binding subunit
MRLILLVLIMLASCHHSNTLNMSLTPLKKGTVLDPSRIFFLNEYYLLENMTVRLVEVDAKAGYKLMLASRIDQRSETEFEIEIKETYFSNGDRVTAENVKASFLRAMSSKNSHLPVADLLESVEVKSNKLVFKLKKKLNDFLYFLTLADLSILHHSQSSLKELRVEDWVTATSGPFSYSIEGEDIFLVKNEYYKLGSLEYPDRVKLLSARGRDTFDDFEKGIVDIGEFNLNSYEKHLNRLSQSHGLHVIGNSGDMINFLALNVDHPKFKSAYTRRWIQKKILESFKLDSRYSNIARKAYQFFTPFVRGFADEKMILAELKKWGEIDLSQVPDELKNGIVISTYQRAFEVTLRGVFNDFEKVLGFPIIINNSVPSTDYENFVKEKKYEAFLGITAMDQVIVGESINLYYFSSSPLFKDVNKKIRYLMDQYQHSDDSKTVSIVNKMAFQMIEDAECIPLFYVASPFFYNKSKLDVSGLDELSYFNLWKLKKNR